MLQDGVKSPGKDRQSKPVSMTRTCPHHACRQYKSNNVVGEWQSSKALGMCVQCRAAALQARASPPPHLAVCP
eukprot:1160726-Pelagomonas_calceolata.AAC.2